MIDIEIRDFQSIEHVKIAVESFTAITGRSNIGKSSIVRAVKSALTNARGTYFVRHGDKCLRRLKGVKTCKCRSQVAIKAGDLDLLWEKGDSCNRTTVNGIVYDKPEDAEFLHPLGLAPIKVGTEQDFIQVSDQFDPPYLLTRTGTAIAELVADVGQLQVINDAIRSAEKDRRDAVQLRRTRESDVVDLEGQIQQFAGLDGAVADVGAIEALAADAAKKSTSVGAITALMVKLTSVAGAVKVLTPISLVEVPVITAVQEQRDRLSKTTLWAQQVSHKAQGVKKLAGLDDIHIPAMTSVEDLSGTCGQLSRYIGQLRAIKERFQSLDVTVAVPEWDPSHGGHQLTVLRTIRKWSDQVITLTDQVGALDRGVAAAEVELAAIQAESDSLGVCPTCVQPVGHLVGASCLAG